MVGGNPGDASHATEPGPRREPGANAIGYRVYAEPMSSAEVAGASEQHSQEAGIASLISIARGQTAQSSAMSVQDILPYLLDRPAIPE